LGRKLTPTLAVIEKGPLDTPADKDRPSAAFRVRFKHSQWPASGGPGFRRVLMCPVTGRSL